MTLMPTYDAMNEKLQDLARAMARAAREVVRETGLPPVNDDRAAQFDEACALYLAHCMEAKLESQ